MIHALSISFSCLDHNKWLTKVFLCCILASSSTPPFITYETKLLDGGFWCNGVHVLPHCEFYVVLYRRKHDCWYHPNNHQHFRVCHLDKRVPRIDWAQKIRCELRSYHPLGPSEHNYLSSHRSLGPCFVCINLTAKCFAGGFFVGKQKTEMVNTFFCLNTLKKACFCGKVGSSYS